MRHLLIAAALAAGPAMADLVTKQGSDEIRLAPTPCVHAGTLAHIDPQYRARFKKMDATIGGQRWYGCWIEVEGWALLIYEDGDHGRLAMSAFKESGV